MASIPTAILTHVSKSPSLNFPPNPYAHMHHLQMPILMFLKDKWNGSLQRPPSVFPNLDHRCCCSPGIGNLLREKVWNAVTRFCYCDPNRRHVKSTYDCISVCFALFEPMNIHWLYKSRDVLFGTSYTAASLHCPPWLGRLNVFCVSDTSFPIGFSVMCPLAFYHTVIISPWKYRLFWTVCKQRWHVRLAYGDGGMNVARRPLFAACWEGHIRS